MAEDDVIAVTKESLWYIDNYVLIRDYYDRTVSRIAARCIRQGNIAVEDYPFYPYIIDVLEELCETGDYILEHKELHPYVEKKIKGGIPALEQNLDLYKQELVRNSSVDMAAKKDADLAAAKDAFSGFTDQADNPTKGAGQSIDDVVAKLMAEQEKLIQKKEESDE
ncbi:MAG: hypothetical protein J6C85_00955 [Alphaproteobacteria bacterium]|nr:hypothetical protein [Alphaproteobacteria bacterium]MBP3515515.1 hypothetical protein [Alphaproteobacteria bacterium]